MVPDEDFICPAWSAVVCSGDAAEATFEMRVGEVDVVVGPIVDGKKGKESTAKITTYALYPLAGTVGKSDVVLSRKACERDHGSKALKKMQQLAIAPLKRKAIDVLGDHKLDMNTKVTKVLKKAKKSTNNTETDGGDAHSDDDSKIPVELVHILK